MLTRVCSVALIGANDIGREGLSLLLSANEFRISCSVRGVKALIDKHMGGMVPDLIVIDLPPASADMRALTEQFAGARIVVLADHYARDDALRCLRAGASGYIVKEISCEPLIASLRLVALGETVIPSQLAFELPEERAPLLPYAEAPLHDMLSDRERDILDRLVQGSPNKIISRELGISEATVKVHVKAVLRKLNVHNRTQAAIWAVTHGHPGTANRVLATSTEPSESIEQLVEELAGGGRVAAH